MKQLVKLILLLLLTVNYAQAQNEVNAPYSRFGLGELQSHFTPTYSAMGSVGTGICSPISINYNNPASYASVFRQRFTIQTGGMHTTNIMQTTDASQVTNFTNISHFVSSFPVAKWWGSSIGLLPYSNMAYSFNDVAATGEQLFFEGEGGLSRFYVGNGFKPHKNLSLGFNVNYLFGNLSTFRKAVFADESFFNARQTDEMLIADFSFDFGLILHTKLGSWNSALGVTYNNGASVDAEYSVLRETYRLNGSIEVVEDTLFNSVLAEEKIQLPTAMGVGFSVSNEQWLIAADYNQQNWSEFLAFGETDDLANSNKISLGAEYTPDRKAINKYAKMIRYRLGAYSANTYLNLRGQHLQEQVVSFGFGLPMKRSGALLNLSAEFGQRGTTEEDLIQDNFARFKVGLVLSDIWFIKRKYD